MDPKKFVYSGAVSSSEYNCSAHLTFSKLLLKRRCKMWKLLWKLQRHLRGVPSDVWIAESLPESENEDYTTIELHFSRPDYHILVEEVNSLSQLPLGMRTFSAKSKNSSQFEKRVTSHYYDFNPSRPMWKFFDVSSCLAELDKLHLKVTLDGKNSLLLTPCNERNFFLTLSNSNFQWVTHSWCNSAYKRLTIQSEKLLPALVEFPL